MTISPVGMTAVDAIAPSTVGVTPTIPDSSSSQASSTQFSGLADLISKLQSLEKTDPAKAKQVLTDISAKLRSEAQTVGGAQAQQLNAAADRFQSAANSGDLSTLQPPQHHGHGGHGHGHKASQAYAQNQQSGESISDLIRGVLSTDGVS